MTDDNSPFFFFPPHRVHKYWWTFAPVLPPNTNCLAYDRLKRVWFDHTGSLFTKEYKYNGRSPYNEFTEEHIAIAFFENWALYEDTKWAVHFLERYGIETKDLIEVRWQYLFEEEIAPRKKPIADIVFWYRDKTGEGILVIEAKRSGGDLNPEKDYPQTQKYLSLPSIDKYKRKHYRFLVDDADKQRISSELNLPSNEIMSWQELGSMQDSFIKDLNETDDVKAFVSGALRRRYQHYGYKFDDPLDTPESVPSAINSRQVSLFVEATKIFAHIDKHTEIPSPPLPYLEKEKDCLTIYKESKTNPKGKQKTAEREKAYWEESYP